MAATNQNFQMYIGDDHYIDVTSTNTDGSVLVLTGVTALNWVLQDNPFSTSDRVYKDITNGGITITNTTGGIFTINLYSNDTKTLPPGDYYHEARVIDANGKQSTLMTGTLTLIQNAKSM